MPVVVSDTEVNMQSFDFANLAAGTFYGESTTSFKATVQAGHHSEFTGHDFQYNDEDVPKSGTIESFAWFTGDELQFNMTGLHISVENVIAVASTSSLADDRALLRQALHGGDRFKGGNGDDIALGFRGGDRLGGGGGDDDIRGGRGADILTGGAGADHLRGGSGADRFVIAAASQSSGVHVDTVDDFSKDDQDTIDFSGIGGLHFIGNSRFHGEAGELRYHFAGGVTTVEGDVDGDGTADVVVDCTGNIHFQQGDFVL